MNRYLYIIAYDISAPKRLRKALYILKDYAWGGQKSVFECFLTQHEKDELCKRVGSVINQKKDYLLAVRISKPDSVKGLGIASIPKNDDSLFYVG